LKTWLFFVYNEIKRRRLVMLSLEKIIETQSKTIEMMANELTLLREQVEYLRQKLYGKSSEKVVHQPGQLSLFGEESLPEEEADLPS
jgi:CII-binding regulator of phage lambda lysogenization HflD